MEHKTEASQAVDDAVERGKFVTEYLRYMAKEAPQSHPEMVYSMAHNRWDGIAGVMWRAGRAALKAQPAPTDPYQLDDDDDARFPNDTNVVILHIDRYWNLRGCEDICAALDAKPAPTEAPNFCARCGKRLHAGSIHTCTPPAPTEAAQGAQLSGNSGELQPSGNTGELAQGEDSAQLDAAHARLLKAVKVYSHGYMQDEAADEEDCVCGAAQHAEAKEVFAAIVEVERASAETGGVK